MKSYVGMYQCFYCNEDIGILMDRRLRNRFEQKVGVLNMDPCDKCKAWMEKGIILISVKDDTEKNPYRTGGWVVITKDAFKRIFNIEPKEFAFITDEVWDKIGLPKKEVKP